MLDIKREAQRANDEEFLQYLEEIFKAYDPELSEQDTIPG
jgi:hypothetical protein